MKKYILIALLILAGEAQAEVRTFGEKYEIDGLHVATATIKQAAIDSNEAVRISTETLAEQMESIIGTSKRIYFNGSPSVSSEGYYTSSDTMQSAQNTFVKTLNGTGILISSWVVNLGNITTIPGGQWMIEFYAKVNNANTTRIYFDVYDGTGTAIEQASNFIATTYLSSPMENDIVEEYFVYFSTGIITPKSRYLTVVMKGNEVGTNPIFTWYVGGNTDAHLFMPVLRAEVSVTKVTASNGLVSNSSTGVGEVNISLPVIYSTFTKTAVFSSTDIASGCDIYTATMTWRPGYDCTIKRMGIYNNFNVGEAATAFVGMALNGVTASTGVWIVSQSSNTSLDLNHWIGSKDIAPDTAVTIWSDVAANSGTRSITFWFDYWRKLW